MIDTLCDEIGRSREENLIIACFYFDFKAREEQSAANVLGALLKQVVRGFDPIPQEIMEVFQRRSGWKLQPHEIVKLLGRLSSLRPTFFCLDALDESTETDRAKILSSLKDVINIAPKTRVFLTGRPHVRAEVERHLPGAVVVSISPRRGDIVQFILKKLEDKDETPDEMNEQLKADILEYLKPFTKM